MPLTKLSVFMVALALLTTSAHVASSQTQEDWRKTDSKKETKDLKLEQRYHGVTPGSGNNLPRVEELKSKSGTWVTWPGFMMLPNGGSRVFLQTTVEVVYKTKSQKNRLSLTLSDAHVHLSNNRNPLVTTHFNTPLKRAYLKKRRIRRRRTLELVIELKVSAKPKISQIVDNDGYHYMFIDFAPGEYPKIEATDEKRPSFTGIGGEKPKQLKDADELPPERKEE